MKKRRSVSRLRRGTRPITHNPRLHESDECTTNCRWRWPVRRIASSMKSERLSDAAPLSGSSLGGFDPTQTDGLSNSRRSTFDMSAWGGRRPERGRSMEGLGRIPEHCEVMAGGTCHYKKVPDQVSILQPRIHCEKDYTGRVRQPSREQPEQARCWDSGEQRIYRYYDEPPSSPLTKEDCIALPRSC